MLNDIVVTANLQLTTMFQNWMMDKDYHNGNKRKDKMPVSCFHKFFFSILFLLYYLQAARGLFIKMSGTLQGTFTLYFVILRLSFDF